MKKRSIIPKVGYSDEWIMFGMFCHLLAIPDIDKHKLWF